MAVQLAPIKIENFFNTDYVDSASYDNLRKVASYVDGLKNCNRKIIHTVLKKNINSKSKVSRLQSTISEFTEYLHGEDGIGKVMVGMAQNYTGANNIPLLQRNGNYGTRLDHVAGASRYIYTQKENYLDSIFRKDDYEILTEQYFEGIKIEPRFFVPVLPMLLINGSEGISTGFAQKILPRDPKVITSELTKILNGKKTLEKVNVGKPYWDGFKGRVVRDEENPKKWYIYGNIVKENLNTIIVDELPVGYDLKKYLSILEDLSDKNVIVSYKDYSEGEDFRFKIRVKREFSQKNSDEQMYVKFKLKASVTENYTTIDENNRIRVFSGANEIFIDYFKVRMEYFNTRKGHLIDNMNYELDLLNSKFIFIKSVIDGTIVINNTTKKNIVDQIEKNVKIIKVEDNYDYLLRMPLYSLTKEKLIELKAKIKSIKEELTIYKGKTLENLWIEDIESIKLN
ncbi:MAG: putative DNA topoisomerase [uncultured marine phage]|uniref:DNA topoisomerase (ATP-hydrolyzing) n=1 Tax=uncultured marine phage TaxID=707152 RepID=A0A8D9C8D3_9VIRU|nr:MAG: putative DNA topoisomerase [uncultured marine phage]